MVSEAAICLWTRKKDVIAQCPGGVVTPAFAFGDMLVESLTANGMQFEIKSEGAKANL
jgi:short subunit dehydrogenase-like uncharacterized protein